MASPSFVIIAGPDKDRVLPIQAGKGLIGRHQDSAYRLNDPRVSRFHCEVVCNGEAVTLADGGGSGGTLINGARISTPRPLRHGDVAQVGETLLRFEVAVGSDSTTVVGAASPRPAGGTPAELDPAGTERLVELAGRKLSHFKVGDVLGKGNTSMVFRAIDTRDGQAVALKVMHPTVAQDDEEMQRFVRAMKAMLPLRHPNLVILNAAGKSGGYCWASMELVEGESLTEVIRRIGVAGMLDWRNAFRVAVHVARALEYAHGEGIIHRDVTPANILLRASDKVVKLGDLMLAKALEGSLAHQVTRPGELVGDINYMSPERTHGPVGVIDGRSDLFSLGATVYALLTGKAPFSGATLLETITRVRQAEPPKLSTYQMGIPSTFEGVLMRMLAQLPVDRFQSATDVLRELERTGKLNGVQV